MAETIDKTKSQTYDFLSKNKSIEDIKKVANIEIREKNRHGGSAFKLVEKNNANHQPVNADPISENEIFYDAVEDLNTISTEKISQTKTIIQEKDKEIQQIKKENEELKIKRSNVNFDKFKYNVVTIYDEKQSKKTGINKIYEEILPINNKIYFITTFQHADNSIREQVLFFQELTNGDIKIFKQKKSYENINEYKKDITLINDISTNKNKVSFKMIPIKDFLKKQQDFKLKPTKKEIGIWIISWLIIPLGVVAINLIHPPLLIMSLVIAGIAIVLRGGAELFSPKSKKVWSWISNKICKNEELKEKKKKERQSIIKNLTSDKLETKLQTQYDILKQKIDNRKEEIPNQLISNKSNSYLENSNIESENNLNKLISNNKINHKSNSFLKNSSVEQLNPNNFDSSIRNTVNNQELQPSTISANTWNKVKCLFT
ncbi:hypothetical protein [Spiroplasma endosymbiont of Lariophagus distinguendus]|uniref:hypothetical protein n=1 Tax=Spiroplasma endosymbiont of Lariophagus distinguendus TaxID=2935082 RepID=UPI002079B514|nr:hypothetical protein [Spiroplasma endosymbiont of Lariophagus distinguendus]